MKIAITGHRHGIGESFAKQLGRRGHDIVGISRSDGENIRRIEHTARLIEPCDMFINNAQSMFAQTELLYAVWEKWKGQNKYIWNISTMMTEAPTNSTPDGHSDITMSQYRTQKLALEQASRQLSAKSSWPTMSIIRPGKVDTQGKGGAPVDTWVRRVLNSFTQDENIHISEISISHADKSIPL